MYNAPRRRIRSPAFISATAVASDTPLLRSELVALQAPDLLKEPSGDATLLVRRSKIDLKVEGEIVGYDRHGHEAIQKVPA